MNRSFTSAFWRTNAASRPLNRVLTGTKTAPAPKTPIAATTHSQELGAHTATRSPGLIPEATIEADALSIRLLISAKSKLTSPSEIASLEPNSLDARATKAGKLSGIGVVISFSTSSHRALDLSNGFAIDELKIAIGVSSPFAPALG